MADVLGDISAADNFVELDEGTVCLLIVSRRHSLARFVKDAFKTGSNTLLLRSDVIFPVLNVTTAP